MPDTGVRRSAAWITALVVLCSTGSAMGQEVDSTTEIAGLMSARAEASRSHLWRVGVWGSMNALGGAALLIGTSRTSNPTRWGFGLQSAAWGVINTGIAVTGLLTSGGPGATGWAQAFGAERTYHDILLLNLGLNVAYMGVGTVMLVAGYREVRSAASWRGHGAALIVQGAGLLALDLLAFVGSRTRLSELVGMAGHLTAGSSHNGWFLAVGF